MTKIAFIGAGSTVFAKNLLGDILAKPALADAHIALHDIEAERLSTSEAVARKVAVATGSHPTIEATSDRRHALDGADHVVTMFQVGGYQPCTVTDFEVPKRFGLRQTIGDTLGIGGIMRGLRTVPVLLDLCADMEELCADALLLQYVNPMAINCWAVERASTINTVGLCHSVQHTARQLADDLGVNLADLQYRAAGINHMSFFLELGQRTESGVVDLLPTLREFAASRPAIRRGGAPRPDGAASGLSDTVRYEICRHFGYFVTESSEHAAEYVPWFIKRHRLDLIEEFNIPLDEYPSRCERQLAAWEDLRVLMEDPDSPIEVTPSDEYGAGIIEAIETGRPMSFSGNVPNHGLINNLPDDCCVEVPCTVTDGRIVPSVVGDLPPQLAALIQTNMNVQRLAVEAALTSSIDHARHAAMLDPHTAADLSLDEIATLVDELLVAHGDWIPALR